MDRRTFVRQTSTTAGLLLGSGCTALRSNSVDRPSEVSYVGDGNWPIERADLRNTGSIRADIDWNSVTAEVLVSDSDTGFTNVSSVAFADRYLATVVGNRVVSLWDTDQQKELWRYETEGNISRAPAFANESVYVSTTKRILAVELSSGKQRWSFDATTLDVPLLPNGSHLVVEDKTVPKLIGLDALSGSQLWEYPTKHSPYGAAIGESNLYVAQRGNEVGTLSSRNVKDGSRNWQREFEPIVVSPSLVGDQVIVGTKAGTIYSLNRADGTTKWKKQIINEEGGVFVPVATDKRTAYVPPNNTDELVALNVKNGSRRWTVPVERAALSVALTTDHVIVPMGEQLVVRKKSNGKRVRVFDFRSDVLAYCPTASGLFVASGDRVLNVS